MLRQIGPTEVLLILVVLAVQVTVVVGIVLLVLRVSRPRRRSGDVERPGRTRRP